MCVFVLSYTCIIYIIYIYIHTYSAAEHGSAGMVRLLIAGILLYLCPCTTMCPRTTIYVSSYCYIGVLILIYMCPFTTIYVSSYYYMCPHTIMYVSSYYCKSVLILLYMCPRATIMCPHTTVYLSAYFYMCNHATICVLNTTVCVLMLLYVSSYYCV